MIRLTLGLRHSLQIGWPNITHYAVNFDLVAHSAGTVVSRAYIQGDSYGNNIEHFVSIGGPWKGVPISYRIVEGIIPDLSLSENPLFLISYLFYAPEYAGAHGYGEKVCHFLVCVWHLNTDESYQFAHDPIYGPASMPEYFPTYQDQFVFLQNRDNAPNTNNIVNFPFGRMVNPLLESADVRTGILEDVNNQTMAGKVFDPYNVNPRILPDTLHGFTTQYYGLNDGSSIGKFDERLGNQNVCIIYARGLTTDEAYELGAPEDRAPYWFNGSRQLDYRNPEGDNSVLVASAFDDAMWVTSKPITTELSGAEHLTMAAQPASIQAISQCLTSQNLPEAMLPGNGAQNTMQKGLVIAALSPIELTLTDPQGRRLGHQSVIGSDFYQEIPNGFYFRDQPNNHKYLMVADPEVGDYTFTVRGTDTGTCRLFGMYSDGTQVANLFYIEGSTTPNQVETTTFNLPSNAAQVPTPPQVYAGADLTSTVGASIMFSGSFTDPNPNDTHQIRWDFGDGNVVADTLTPVHMYSTAGNFVVALTITDSSGFVITDTLEVTIVVPPTVTPTLTMTPTPTATPTLTPTSTPLPTATATSSTAQSFYLRGTGPNNNPPTLYLDTNAPSATTARYKDSTSVNFNNGNPWKEIGTWSATAPSTNGTLTTLNDLNVWLGLKNSDDQGTRFDVRAEIYKNGTLLSSGETYCIQGITRNAHNALESAIAFQPFVMQTFDGTSDVISLKVLTRIGTNGSGGLCGGHSNAVGLRLYFDAVNRASRFAPTFAP